MESFFDKLPRSILWQSELKTLNSMELMVLASDLEDTAKQSHPVKLRKLGLLYAVGGTLSKNPSRAFNLFKRAASLGDKNSAFYVGMSLREGFGVTQNLTESFAWLRTASSQNQQQAFYELARAFENGWGCKKNLEEANALYKKAATLGDKNALKKIIKDFVDHPAKFQKGLEWIQHASDNKVPEAMVAQARRILESDCKDWSIAISLLQVCCEEQDDIAMAELAKFWKEGRFYPADQVAAFVYGYLAASHGNYVCERWIDIWRNELSDLQLQEAAQIVSLSSRKQILDTLVTRGKNRMDETEEGQIIETKQ